MAPATFQRIAGGIPQVTPGLPLSRARERGAGGEGSLHGRGVRAVTTGGGEELSNRWTEVGARRMTRLVRIAAVTPLNGFRVRVEFTDGSEREVDLEPYLRGPIFESPRRDPALFASVRVDPELRTLVWPNGADIDPDVLYHGRRPASWAANAATGTEP
jgi:hypothetical protein